MPSRSAWNPLPRSLALAVWTLFTEFGKTFIFDSLVPCPYPDSGTVLLLVHWIPYSRGPQRSGEGSLPGGMPGLGPGQDPSGRVTLWPVVACVVARPPQRKWRWRIQWGKTIQLRKDGDHVEVTEKKSRVAGSEQGCYCLH